MDSTDVTLIKQRGYRIIKVLHEPEANPDDEIDAVLDDSLVVLAEGPNQRLVAIKRQGGCNACLEYEYQAGRRLFSISQSGSPALRIIPETIAYFTDPSVEDRQYLVTEYVSGASLSDLLAEYKRWNSRQQRLFTDWYVRMLYTILEFSRQYGFTHYDLHAGNIIVSTGDTETFLDPTVTFRLIDFGYSHVPGITGWARLGLGALVIGAIPSVWDLWYDLVRLVSIYHWTTRTPLSINEQRLLRENRFNGDNLGEPSSATVIYEEQEYPGAELIPGIGKVYDLSPALWDDGFWVPSADKVDCTVSRQPTLPRSTSNEIVTVEQKIAFGEFMTCIKKLLVRKRQHQDPILLLEAFDLHVRST